jgi:hypothetical protein
MVSASTIQFNDISIAMIIEALATISLSSYFVILTFSFFKFRLVRKQEELEDLVRGLNLGQSDIFKKNIEKEFSPKDYVLPLAFVTILSFIGLFLIFLGWLLYYKEADPVHKSILWSGSDFWINTLAEVKEMKSVAIVAWALFGAYLSGAQYIYRRFATIDLTPGNFFSIGIRMIVAPIVSLIIAFIIGPNGAPNTILAIAFLTGLFPERGFKLMMDKMASIFPKENSKMVDNIPLEAIQGISYFHRLRLNEIGIDNVQNLAQYNFLLIIIKTPFPVRTLLDWVAQAKLMIEFQEDTVAFKKVGIRSAIDYLDALHNEPSRIGKISSITGINELALEIVLINFEKDKSIWLLNHFRENLESVSIESSLD